MKASDIDSYISSLIDDLEDTAHSEVAELGSLLTYPTPVVDDCQILEVLVVASRLRNAADALLTRATAAVERSGVAARKRDTATNMLIALGIPPVVAGRITKVAKALRLFPTLDSTTREARLSGEHAAAVVTSLEYITKRATDLDVDEKGDLMSNLLGQASAGTPHDVTTWARKTALELVPDDAAPIAENRELNDMTLSTGDDGRTYSTLDLDVVAAEKLRIALEPLSKPIPAPDGTPDPRTTGQRRADAFEEVLDAYLRADDRPLCGGHLPHITLTFPKNVCAEHHSAYNGEQASLGIADELEQTTLGPIPPPRQAPRLEFGEPVSEATADMLSCDCELMAMILDTDGVPLDIKQMQRLFPPELRRALIIRDQGCSFPGCGQPPSRCQAHHLIHWARGGKTTLDNGGLLCQRHHTMIHQTDWEMRMGSDRHPWFSPPPARPERPRQWIRSHARRTMNLAPTAAA
ncbi:hypothetical protein GOEFS_090_00030 [Gordonia effusa NBRC 100432]|uniref:HNH nuclease domain-containing protein n=1 Tax=Gordonia effusa NBRC 100432 TaxID=1077974 RepID=H0R357_9ACTN|nr:HNH endonuclease signature motif containing protein [Gordonia effusa]GAB19508.1 hypothetical protein GOEFS_090_00030 [Gordonia effusa NBRC 100432]